MFGYPATFPEGLLPVIPIPFFLIPIEAAMICLNVILTVKDPADVPEVRTLLKEQGRLSRMEPGCLRFEIYHSKENAAVFILNERWESQSALDVHRKAEAYSEIYQPKVLPKVDRTPHPAELVE